MPRDRKKRKVEDVELTNTAFGSQLILDHYAERLRRGEVVGLMVIAELPGGGVELKMSSTANVAERLGRLRLLEDEVLERAVEGGS